MFRFFSRNELPIPVDSASSRLKKSAESPFHGRLAKKLEHRVKQKMKNMETAESGVLLAIENGRDKIKIAARA